MNKNTDIMFKRISELTIELSETKIKLMLNERKLKNVIEENDQLINEILKSKEKRK